MSLNIRNLSEIRAFVSDGKNIGQRLYEAFQDVIAGHNLVEQQTNSSANAQRAAAPPAINAVNVVGQNGHFNIAITDNNQNIYSGVRYYVEHADNPSFTNPHIVDLGSSRNHSLFLGNVTRYWRAYSAYPASPGGSPVYHGGALQPAAVNGGGAIGGPFFQASQGSGTGAPGEGLSGPGPLAYRTTNGKPPIRVSK